MKYCDQCVRDRVCLSPRISNKQTSKFHQILVGPVVPEICAIDILFR